MPVVTGRTTIGIGATNNNLFAGSPFEFAPGPSRIRLAVVTQASLLGDVPYSFSSWQDIIIQDGIVAVEFIAGGGPRLPDNIVAEDVAAGGDRMVLSVTNNDAAAGDVAFWLEVIPIPMRR